ncbi:MAG: hypothetical protein AAF146_15590, partial [Bacteroidota bacterium]
MFLRRYRARTLWYGQRYVYQHHQHHYWSGRDRWYGSATLTVNNTLFASFTAPADLCLDAGVQSNLGGGLPVQGTATGDLGVYSGPGVTDNGNGSYDFNPATAGAGIATITYTYTDEFGCSASAMDDIEVFAVPNVSLSDPGDFCVDAGV